MKVEVVENRRSKGVDDVHVRIRLIDSEGESLNGIFQKIGTLGWIGTAYVGTIHQNEDGFFSIDVPSPKSWRDHYNVSDGVISLGEATVLTLVKHGLTVTYRDVTESTVK